jgi:hypothetical protein
MKERAHLMPDQEPPADLEADHVDLSDQTPKMMGMVALTTMVTFIIYGAARLIGTPPAQALVAAGAGDGLLFMAAFVMTIMRKESFSWLLAMIATATALTGVCFAISQTTHNGLAIVTGGIVMFIGILTSLFRNIDDRVRFTPLVISMLVSVMIVLMSLT